MKAGGHNRFLFAVLGAVLAGVGTGIIHTPSCRAAETGGGITLPAFKKVTLENGMTLFLMERHQLPLVSLHWLMKSGGSLGDPAGREGAASLTANLLRKGTQTRTADQISEALDFVGATYDASAALEYSAGSAECVKKDLDLVLGLVAETLLAPSFPADEVTKLEQQEVDSIKEAKEVPGEVIGRYYDAFLFNNHGYGRPVSGTEVTLTKISRPDIVDFFERHYLPNEILMAFVGDFSSSELEAKVREKFGSWKAGKAPIVEVAAPTRKTGRHAEIIDKPDATQTFFRFGNVGLARTSEDWIPIRVVNTLFGGRFTSMINSALRIESGLTYGASSFFGAHKLPGAFAIGSFTPNEKTGQALEMALGVLKKLHEQGLSAEQLASAKSYIKGQFGPTLETNDQLANMLCEMEFYGLGPDYINTLFQKIDEVSLGDTQRVIEKYYPKADLDFVFIGQSAVIEPVARKLAEDVRRKVITEPGF